MSPSPPNPTEKQGGFGGRRVEAPL